MILCAIAPIAAALAPTAGAAVQLSGVASGSASISQKESVTTIKTSNDAILNFSQFNIAAGSTVDFLQPSVASRVLDRVSSATPSLINGSLISNGTIYLINPAGVIFGAGATVDVNRFYVAGSHMSNQDFLGNVDHFSGVSGRVSNSGQIHANQVYLVGSQVINQGSIVSPGGVVAMVSGSDVIVSEPGSHVMATVVPVVSATGAAGGSQQPDLRISALAAGDAYSLAIRHTGSIQAGTVLINGGSGQVQISGSIDASSQIAGGKGGNVSITGGEVDLVSAIIDASGPAGGGEVLIGGGPHGGGDPAHATVVSLDSGSTIDADATNDGHGGTIVLWADSTTSSSGVLSARGGPIGGDGGYIETSGPSLEINSSPDASAPHGKAGSWVLDPATVEIVLSGGDGTDTVNASAIETSLDGGTNVTLTATGTLMQDSNAPIVVNSTAASSLILQAGGDMTLSGGISTMAGSSPLTVELDQTSGASNAVVINSTININGPLSVVGGNVSLLAGNSLTADGVTIGSGIPNGGTTPVATGSVILSGPVNTEGGAFTVTGTSFQNAAAVSDGGIATAGNALSVNTSSGTGALFINGPITWTGGTGRSITLEGGGAVTVGASGSIASTGATPVPVSLYTTGISTALVTLTGTVNTNGAFTSDGGEFVISEPAVLGTTVLTAASISIDTATTTPDSLPVNSGAVEIEGPVLSQGTFIAAGTTFTDNEDGTISASGDVDINSTGDILVSEPVVTGGGNFTATVGTSFTTSGSGTITTAGGNVAITTSSSEGITIGSNVNTGGGGFTAVGQVYTQSATITDGGASTGSGSFSVDTSSTANDITIGDPIIFTGGSAARSVTIQGGGNITISSTGGITATSTVGLYTTGASSAITVTGAVSTTGAFIADGGDFTVSAPAAVTAPASEPTILTAQTVDINTSTLTPDALMVTLGTISIAGPVVTNGGDFDAGGTVDFISNQFGSITTNGGNVNITNPGLIAVGQPVNTGGGNFTSVDGNSFGTATNGTLTTGGGNIILATATTSGTTDEVTIGNAVNTGGGSFSVTGIGFEDTALISDGGVATPNGTFTINTVANGTSDITNLEISWTGGSGRSVLVEGVANITVSSITGTGTTPLPVTLYTTATIASGDAITLNGPVTATGPFVASGADFDIASGGSLSATTVNINTVTSVTIGTPMTLTQGTVTFSGPVVSHGALNVDGSSFDVDSTGAMTSNGGAINVESTGVVTIEGGVNSDGGAISILSGSTFTSDSDGTITSSGGDVAIQSESDLTISAEVNTGGGNFTATGSTFTNNAEISDGGVNDSKAQGLTINASAGDITVGGEISWAASLSPVTFSVPSGSKIELGAEISANPAEALNLSNIPIAVTSTSAVLSGGNITLGAVTNASSSTPELEINSSGSVSLQTVGTPSAPFGELIITGIGNSAPPTITLHGDINTIASVDFGGTVILPGNVEVFDGDTTDTDTAIIEFDGDVEGPGGLSVFLPGKNYGQIRFNNNVGNLTPVAYLQLFPGNGALVGFRWGSGNDPPGVTEQQPLTTINIATGGNFAVNNVSPPVRELSDIGLFSTIDSYGPLTINIGSSPSTTNRYVVGQNEKLSVYGSLTLSAPGGTITTGDISTLGNMTLNAATIRFRLRGPTFVTSTTVVDSGMDLIAAGEMTLPGSATYVAVSGPTVPGAFDVPGFIAQSYSTSSNIGSIAGQLKTAFSVVGAISPTVLFGNSNLLLDLTPNTLTTSIPTFVPPTPFVFDFAIAGAAPREQLVAGTVPLDFKTAYPPAVPGPIIQEEFSDAGVYTHEPSVEEILGAVGTMAVYDDMPDQPRPRASDYRVAVNRFDSRRLGLFLAEYKRVFGQDATAERTRITNDLQLAWNAYVSQNADQPVGGAGFAQYCASTPSAAAALSDLGQLHGLRIQLAGLGLSYKEAQVAFQYNVLSGLSAIGMRGGDLATAVVNSPVNR
jgi:filamentous hemagglutinin family protein